MQVYDFDNTIYDGESVVDFFLFCARKKPSLLRFVPLMVYFLVRYKAGRLSVAELEEKTKKYAMDILLSMENIPDLIKEFWDKNQHKIKEFYLSQQRPDDVIVSASCGFILKEICARLGISHCLCSEIDIKTGDITEVCYRGRKPEIFKIHFPHQEIDAFYTDSMNDLPMIELSNRAFLVKGEKITEIRKA